MSENTQELIDRLRAATCAGSVCPLMCEAADTVEQLKDALLGCCTCAQYGPMTTCPACKVLSDG